MNSSIITAILIDDEIQAIANLDGLLNEYPRIKVLDKITDPAASLMKIVELDPDLIFIDIQMPEKNGFEIVSELTGKGCTPAIIFVTGFDNYAINAIRAAAFDYLVKPVNPEELKQALDRLTGEKREKNRDDQVKLLLDRTINKSKIKLSTTGGFTLLDPDEIIYINADWNYAEIFTDVGKSELVTTNLGTLQEILPQNNFYRISRSVIINTSYLKKVSRKKRMAYLIKDGKEYTFKIPLLNIRKLEAFLEG
ncbi:MAG: LytTR family DNA-binding domain-containing protein [Bacteroidetes bacterium]|nr:LytTR family DNA-binding domain-containing protein [Bacteroidota bacterium]